MRRTMYLFIGLFIITTILCLAFLACRPDKEVEIDKIVVDRAEIVLKQKGESIEFNVIYTGEWHLEAEGLERYLGPNMAGVKNFILSPSSGKGNTKVRVTLNDEIGENYEVDLNVIGKNNQVVIKLKSIVNATVQ